MAYNLQSIRNQVKNRISDQNFSTAMINQFINDEQREVLNYYDLPFNRTSATLTLTTGTNTVALPSNCQKIKNLEITAPAGYDNNLDPFYLEYNRFAEAFRPVQYYSANQPSWWTVYNTSIIFMSNADNTYTLQIDYINKPLELSGETDVPVIPEEFQEILVLGAMVRCLEANDDNDIAAYQNGKKNLLVQAMLKRYAPQQTAKTPIMRNTYRGI